MSTQLSLPERPLAANRPSATWKQSPLQQRARRHFLLQGQSTWGSGAFCPFLNQLRAWKLWHSSSSAQHRPVLSGPEWSGQGNLSGPRASQYRCLEGGAAAKDDPRNQRNTSFSILAQPGSACRSSTEGMSTKAKTVPLHPKRTLNLWVLRASCWGGTGASESARPCIRDREEQKQKEEEQGGEAHLKH